MMTIKMATNKLSAEGNLAKTSRDAYIILLINLHQFCLEMFLVTACYIP